MWRKPSLTGLRKDFILCKTKKLLSEFMFLIIKSGGPAKTKVPSANSRGNFILRQPCRKRICMLDI